MKKFLILLCICLGLTASAENQWYNASSYAYKQINSYGYWENWSDWVSCNVSVKIDTTNDIVYINSNSPQTYYVYSYDGTFGDGEGGQQAYFKVIDQDGDYGTMRLRIEFNGNSQIYIEFSNIMWVYNVKRTY